MIKKLLAPCGINCAICKGYLREKNTCPGCRDLNVNNSNLKSCIRCIIKNCEKLKKLKSGFCYECEIFPCKRMKGLNKRYTTKYHYDTFETLEIIKNKGVDELLKTHAKKYSCPNGTICVHDGKCYKNRSK